MSIHPSLKLSEKNKKQRSVLKRIERLKMMMDKGKWKEGDNIYGLPKIKTIRMKIKKEKAAEKVEAAATEAVAPATPEAKAESTGATKTATPKNQDKK